MKIYSYSRCSTCRRALARLQVRKIKYSLIDIVEIPPSKEEIIDAVRQYGDRKYILNTSGKSYRSIGSASIKVMSDSKVIDLLASDGKLIKRPFVVTDDAKIIVGFNEVNWENLFSN